MEHARAVLNSFTVANIPDLDIAVLGALELFADTETVLPSIPRPFHDPLVVGSGNAYAAGTLLFEDARTRFADESSFEEILNNNSTIDGVVLISASGGKHAVEIAQIAKRARKPIILLTCTADPRAAASIESDAIIVFPKNREPYTYNTSTYLGMILAHTAEDPDAIRTYLLNTVLPLIPNIFSAQSAFTFVLPTRFARIAPMVRTKFDELFGPKLVGRIFTEEEIKHAKTVVPSKSECFVYFGLPDAKFTTVGSEVHIPLAHDFESAALMAITYFVVGHIQKQQPPHFRKSIEAYTLRASDMFGYSIEPIVT